MAPPLKCPATAFAIEGFSATQRILFIAGALVCIAYFARAEMGGVLVAAWEGRELNWLGLCGNLVRDLIGSL